MKKIVGYENEKNEVAQLHGMLLNADAYKSCGIRIPRGLVLFGEPGVGKTQLAKSIAGDGIYLAELRAASCCNDVAGEELQAVFESAKKNQPAVILLDELDKIAGTSDRFFMENNNDIQKMLLQEIDSLGEDDDILVVATCNDTFVLGDALLRSGRFDRQIHVDLPDEATRELVLKEYFGKIKINNNLDFNYLARIIPGYSGARIECLANEVGIKCIDKDEITLDDVRLVMNKLAFKGSEKGPIKDREKMRMIAIHEAGHAIVAIKLSPDKIFGASILPQGDSNGHIYFVNPDEGVTKVKDIEDEVAVLLAGHVAEKLILGEYLVGSSSDLSGAEARIRFLATNQGAYGYKYLVGSSGHRFELSLDERSKSNLSKFIEEKLNKLDEKAKTIINENRIAFDRIVDELIANQTLSREDLLGIIEDENAIKCVA